MTTKLRNAIAGFCAVATIFAISGTANAQLLGQVSTARTLVRGANDVGGYLGLFENATTIFGQFRRGMSSNLDFGLKAGLIDPDGPSSDASFIIGGDLKYNVMSAGYDPFDMAIGAQGSFYDISNLSVFSVGGAVIISRDYAITGGGILAPYGAVNLRVEHASYSRDGITANGKSAAVTANQFDGDDTSLEIGGVAGVKWELSDFIDALGEIVIDDQWGLILGLNFKI